jgi:hypothetical protein
MRSLHKAEADDVASAVCKHNSSPVLNRFRLNVVLTVITHILCHCEATAF